MSVNDVELKPGDRIYIKGQPPQPVTWWEKVVLWFVPVRYTFGMDASKPVHYKRWRGHTYTVKNGKVQREALNGIYRVTAVQ